MPRTPSALVCTRDGVRIYGTVDLGAMYASTDHAVGRRQQASALFKRAS